ncbi:MAG: hypothetical protein A2Y38_00690 [Spirochaetes bacterium GWB1_59_5]|nr:MAG: hypothetical protein A2Y38_00690 [Spirochaetes bacterium GWB1_59_5]
MKRLTFAFVIVLSLFVLGGCDKLLEGFFPEDTDSDQNGGGTADYSVAVTVEYDQNLLLPPYNFGPGSITNDTNPPIIVAFIPFIDSFDGNYQIDWNGIVKTKLWENTFTEDTDGQRYTTTVEFSTWKYSTYKVLVWFDESNDESWEQYAVYDKGTLAIRNNSNDYWVDFRNMNPQNAGIQMNCRVGPSSMINTEQLTADPYAVYASGGVYPYVYINSSMGNNVLVNSEVYLDSYGSGDTDGWITSTSWSITNPNGSNVFNGYGQYVSFYPDTVGPYLITLTATDNQGNVSSATYNLTIYAAVSIPVTDVGGTDTNTINVLVVSDYRFYISTPGNYLINWEDSYQNGTPGFYTGDITASYIDSYGNYLFTDVDSAYLSPQPVYVDSAQYITIRVNPYYSAGTCHIWITPQ